MFLRNILQDYMVYNTPYIGGLLILKDTLADPGAPPARGPPTGSNFFIFAYIFTKKRMRRKSPAPPPNGKSWIRH